MSESEILYRPSEETISESRLTHFRNWLEEHYSLTFEDYQGLWSWSVENIEVFWKSIWEYFDVITHSDYKFVVKGEMPQVEWFSGARINYAEHVFRQRSDDFPAIIFASERQEPESISWGGMTDCVSRLQTFMHAAGIGSGDRVVAFMPNIPEATYGFLATCALGAIWSSCSPDFGADSVLDRFSQIEPKMLLCVDGYQYGGKAFDKQGVIADIIRKLPSLETVVCVRYLNPDGQCEIPNAVTWQEVMKTSPEPLRFAPVPFDHPIWVLYSSGTTGVPKAITHGHGGMLLEHLKYLAFHNDVRRGEVFFWFSTTGWMMWNFVQAALLHGATIVLYDGSPGYPGLTVLWKLAEQTAMQHFGTSAPFLIACMKAQQSPKTLFNLRHLRSVSSTGAPLPAEAFDWVYQHVKDDVWLWSMSGGTDVCTAFVGGCPEMPVRRGEIQCRALGCALRAYSPEGHSVIDEVGEMVITRPMPSMPVFFWNDPEQARYRQSYFEAFPGIWRHGDWIYLSEKGSLIMYGRSDATLNRQGVRIGTAEIYRALHAIPEVKDALIVHLEDQDLMPLFVVLQSGHTLDQDLIAKIRSTLREKCSPRHVPDRIIAAPDIPYTISGKKMEAPVKKVLSGKPVETSLNTDAMRNPEAMQFFLDLRMTNDE